MTERRYFRPIKEVTTESEMEKLFFSWYRRAYPEKEIMNFTIEKSPCWIITYSETFRNPRVEVKR